MNPILAYYVDVDAIAGDMPERYLRGDKAVVNDVYAIRDALETGLSALAESLTDQFPGFAIWFGDNR